MYIFLNYTFVILNAIHQNRHNYSLFHSANNATREVLIIIIILTIVTLVIIVILIIIVFRLVAQFCVILYSFYIRKYVVIFCRYHL